MPHGVETPPELVAEFRAHYLYSGNATESARKVGLPQSTGRLIARRLVEEPEFVADRRALRTRALDELVAMRMRVAQKALTRFEDDSAIQGFAEGAIDKRPDYGRLVMDAEKNAQHLAKIDQANEPGGPARPFRIEIVNREDETDDGNDPGLE